LPRSSSVVHTHSDRGTPTPRPSCANAPRSHSLEREGRSLNSAALAPRWPPATLAPDTTTSRAARTRETGKNGHNYGTGTERLTCPSRPPVMFSLLTAMISRFCEGPQEGPSGSSLDQARGLYADVDGSSAAPPQVSAGLAALCKSAPCCDPRIRYSMSVGCDQLSSNSARPPAASTFSRPRSHRAGWLPLAAPIARPRIQGERDRRHDCPGQAARQV
jgi:hypothetical protein